MNKNRLLLYGFSICFVISLITVSHVSAYKEWHEAEVTVKNVKPWYGMFLETERVNMDLTITNHMNETHSFCVLERTDSFTNPELTRHINNTIYDTVSIKPNSTYVIPYSQQLPAGSWQLLIMVLSENCNYTQVDDHTEYFVVQPIQDFYSFIAALAGLGAGIVAVGGLMTNTLSNRLQTKSHNSTIFLSLENEFKKIEMRFTGMHKDKEKMTPDEWKIASLEYLWDFLYFHEKISYMKEKKMIPKDTFMYFDKGIGMSLSIIALDWKRKQVIMETTKNLQKWSAKLKIPIIPLAEEMQLEFPDGMLKTPMVKKSDLSKGVKLDQE